MNDEDRKQHVDTSKLKLHNYYDSHTSVLYEDILVGKGREKITDQSQHDDQINQ